MKSTAQLTWQDYLDAQRLHRRPVGWLRIGRYVLVGYIALVLLGLVLFWLLGALDTSTMASLWYIWPVVAIGAGLYALDYFVYLPWNVRRIFEQQKEMGAPFEFEITPEALLASNQYGYSNRPWGNFRKWREDRKLLLLYFSDVLYIFIPKRFLTDEQAAEIRARLAENAVMDANKPGGYSRYVVPITLALLLIVSAAMCYLGFRQPLP